MTANLYEHVAAEALAGAELEASELPPSTPATRTTARPVAVTAAARLGLIIVRSSSRSCSSRVFFSSARRLGSRRARVDGDARARPRRRHDRVGDDCGAAAVLEARLPRGHRASLENGGEEVAPLVHHRVLPPEDVARRPPEVEERVVGIRHEHVAVAAEPLALVGCEVHVEPVQILEVPPERALGAVELDPLVPLPPERDPGGLERCGRLAS